MSKSNSKKLRDLQNRKPNESKRKNPDRYKHGCSRLHELRLEKETKPVNNIGSDKPVKVKTGFMSKLKSKIKW